MIFCYPHNFTNWLVNILAYCKMCTHILMLTIEIRCMWKNAEYFNNGK